MTLFQLLNISSWCISRSLVFHDCHDTMDLDNLDKMLPQNEGNEMEWKVADAKNRFSEVMTKALQEGPQRIRRRDGTVVMISEKELECIEGKKPGFKEFLLSIPDTEGVDISRDLSLDREFDW